MCVAMAIARWLSLCLCIVSWALVKRTVQASMDNPFAATRNGRLYHGLTEIKADFLLLSGTQIKHNALSAERYVTVPSGKKTYLVVVVGSADANTWETLKTMW